MRLQEETPSAPRGAVEGIKPHASGSVEAQEPIVPHPPLELVGTPGESATLRRNLDSDIFEPLKQVVDKINIVVGKVDKSAKVRVI